MSEPQAHDAELKALETALGALAPAPAALDRDRLLFRAGQASVPRRGWPWPSAVAALLLVSAGLGTALIFRPEQRPVERIVYVTIEKKTPVPASGVPSEVSKEEKDRWQAQVANLKLRAQIIRDGVDSLPPITYVPAAEQPETLEDLLGLPPGSLKRPAKTPS